MIELLAQLYRDEGEILNAYQDSLGFWTIGIGRLIDIRKGGGITHEEAGLLLLNDIKKHTDQVITRFPWVLQLSPARLGVLINMHFQLGDAGLAGFVNTLQLIKDRKYSLAATAMLQSKWAQQTPNRAKRLSDQMRLDKWQ
jgi:lysozyme